MVVVSTSCQVATLAWKNCKPEKSGISLLFLHSLHTFGRLLHGNIDSLTFLATFFLFDAMKILLISGPIDIVMTDLGLIQKYEWNLIFILG
eukprot:UN24485